MGRRPQYAVKIQCSLLLTTQIGLDAFWNVRTLVAPPPIADFLDPPIASGCFLPCRPSDVIGSFRCRHTHSSPVHFELLQSTTTTVLLTHVYPPPSQVSQTSLPFGVLLGGAFASCVSSFLTGSIYRHILRMFVFLAKIQKYFFIVHMSH